RCGLVLAAARDPAPAAGLVVAGLGAAALTARAARGCQVGQRWAGWAALLIGIMSAPQAAASGYRTPYTIPDTATAALGILLAITVLATAGRTHRRDATPTVPARGEGSHEDFPSSALLPQPQVTAGKASVRLPARGLGNQRSPGREEEIVALASVSPSDCRLGAVLRDGGLADGSHRPTQGPGGGLCLGQLRRGCSEAREAICGVGHLDRNDLAAARRSPFDRHRRPGGGQPVHPGPADAARPGVGGNGGGHR